MSILIHHVGSRISSIISLIALLIFLPLLIIGISSTIQIFTRATGTPANIIVDTKLPLEPIRTDFYHAFAQGGEESSDMLAAITNDVKALHPKVIRLDHLYDHYRVVSRGDTGLRFDWSQLDASITTIIRTGAKPLLVLSYMPDVIAKDGNIIGPPNDWNEWSEVVKQTIEHYSGKSGFNLSDIYYEVWNEPDLAQFGGWKAGSYRTLYHYAAIGADTARNTNKFSLCGPATTGLYQSWIEALVKSEDRVDCFSWHSYLSQPGQFTKDQQNIIKWLLPYPTYTLLPKLITEFGFTGDKSSAYNTMYAAAHTAAIVRQLMSGGPTYLFSFELKDGPNDTSGNGWGLITHDSNGLRKKPRYYIYNFLDAMAGTRLTVTGEGTWVTAMASVSNGVIRILMVNFDPTGSHSENVPVSIVGLQPGVYSVRQRFLLGRDVTNTVTVQKTTLSTQIFMSPESTAILEIFKAN